jgi:hypothetical protein
MTIPPSRDSSTIQLLGEERAQANEAIRRLARGAQRGGAIAEPAAGGHEARAASGGGLGGPTARIELLETCDALPAPAVWEGHPSWDADGLHLSAAGCAARPAPRRIQRGFGTVCPCSCRL